MLQHSLLQAIGGIPWLLNNMFSPSRSSWSWLFSSSTARSRNCFLASRETHVSSRDLPCREGGRSDCVTVLAVDVATCVGFPYASRSVLKPFFKSKTIYFFPSVFGYSGESSFSNCSFRRASVTPSSLIYPDCIRCSGV